MKIIIPFKTPTINNMYVQFRNLRIKSKISKEQAEEVKKIVLNTPTEIIKGELNVNITIYSNWYNKDKTIKKRDIANLEKFITDSIFNNLEDMDDKQIFNITMNKIQSNEEYTIVEINPIE